MTNSLSLSDGDRAQIAAIQGKNLTASTLIERLRTDRWAVRRAAVAALAELAEGSTHTLCEALVQRRDHEGQIAAIVDALSASHANVIGDVEALATHDNPAVVCDVATILGRRRSVASIPLLAKLTTYPDDNVAVAAVEALGRIGGDEAVDALLALCETRSFFRVFPAIDVLGRSGDARATAVLLRLLDDPLYAPEAARALGRTGDERALEVLVRLLAYSSESLVRVAAVAITDVHDRLYGRFGRSRGPLELQGATSPIARLLDALSSADETEETAIVRVLGLLGSDQAAAALIELVTRGDGRAVATAESVLRDLGPLALAPMLDAIRSGDSDTRATLLPLVGARAPNSLALAACLSDPSPRVRTLAADSLARMGATAAVPLLFDALRDPDQRVAQAAIAAIQALGSADTELLAIKTANDPDPAVRRAGIRILSYFGYAAALEPLLQAAVDPDERVREVALGGLPLLDDPRADEAIAAALHHSGARTRAAAVRALGHVDRARDVADSLIAALSDTDPWVRYFSCQALARRGDARAVPALVACLDDEAGQVRVGAVEALAQFSEPRAIAALTSAAEGTDPDLKRAAIIGFGLTGNTAALPIIARAMHDPDASTRLVAVSALANLGGPEVFDAIAGATRDPDSSVASAALSVLGGRPEPAAFELLLPLLQEASTSERALHAIAQPVLGRVHAIAAALSSASGEQASLLAAALVRMKTPDANAALIGALSSPTIRTRRAVATALAVVPLPEHRSAMLHALNAEHDADIRKLLRKALNA